MSDAWPFVDPPNFKAYTTRQIMEHRDAILTVYHDAEDGAWQFIGGPWEHGDLIIVCLSHAVERDASVLELADLPSGWMARREGVDQAWVRDPIPADEPGQ